jgi:glycosyltransferase involved in cell wall biosynthesis
MTGTAKVSIIIRAYNEESHIEKLLLGIRAQTLEPYEVILVDSGSTDQTVTIAERYGTKIVPISKHDFTFGRSLNYGCRAAEGDILVFVSAHVYPTHRVWLERLVAPFFSEPKVVLCYGKQRGGTANKFSEHQLFAKWFPNRRAFPQKNYFCNNANCAIRKSVWETLPYDETLTGLEDLDWAKRAQAEGGWLVYEPDAKIIHVHDETWPQVRNRYRREALALRRIDDHVRFSFLDFVRLLAGNIVADCRAAARKGILRAELNSILHFRFHQLLGTWQGHTGPSDISGELRQRFYYPVAKHDHHGETETHDRHVIDYDRLKTDRSEVPSLVVVSSNPVAGKTAARQSRK